jgi:hypothetical protein
VKSYLKIPPQTEPVLWGAVGGAAALAFVGFMFGGWVTGGKATELARQQSEKAVVTALAPICVDKFQLAKNADENLGKLTAISSSWEKSTYVSKGGWATFNGSTEPNSAVAQACADLLGSLKK